MNTTDEDWALPGKRLRLAVSKVVGREIPNLSVREGCIVMAEALEEYARKRDEARALGGYQPASRGAGETKPPPRRP